MLAIFLDVQNEILEITREFEVMQRKIQRFESAKNVEDKDSHMNVGVFHLVGPSPDVSTAFIAGWKKSSRT